MKKVIQMAAVFALILGLSFVLSGPAAGDAEKTQNAESVQMLCLNIGKADCFLIRVEGDFYLIDTGYEQTAKLLLTALDQLGVKRLSGVFITHNHKDHVGGLLKLVESGTPIDAFYASQMCIDGTGADHPAVAAAAARGQKVTFLKAGDTVPISQTASFDVLAPLSLNTDNENNNSLVMRLNTAQGAILLTGDMKSEEEYELLKAGTLTPCAVLKVPFHGDDTATSSAFVSAVKPRLGIISTSTAEESDTPSKDTLRTLAFAGCETLVTQDAEDAILVTLTNGVPSAKSVSWALPQKETALSLLIDLPNDVLYIKNTSAKPVSLDGAELFSTRGEDLFALPAGLTVPANGSISVASSASGSKADVLLGSKKRIWHKNKYDQAILYDAYGRVLARTDNGKAE